MIPFNFHHLYYFYTIAKKSSVSKAAKQLRLAQPTLSAQLKQDDPRLRGDDTGSFDTAIRVIETYETASRQKRPLAPVQRKRP